MCYNGGIEYRHFSEPGRPNEATRPWWRVAGTIEPARAMGEMPSPAVYAKEMEVALCVGYTVSSGSLVSEICSVVGIDTHYS